MTSVKLPHDEITNNIMNHTPNLLNDEIAIEEITYNLKISFELLIFEKSYGQAKLLHNQTICKYIEIETLSTLLQP